MSYKIEIKMTQCERCGYFSSESEFFNDSSIFVCPKCGIEYIKREGIWFENNIETLIKDILLLKKYFGENKWTKIWEDINNE